MWENDPTKMHEAKAQAYGFVALLALAVLFIVAAATLVEYFGAQSSF
jgi:hypothetical protein